MISLPSDEQSSEGLSASVVYRLGCLSASLLMLDQVRLGWFNGLCCLEAKFYAGLALVKFGYAGLLRQAWNCLQVKSF